MKNVGRCLGKVFASLTGQFALGGLRMALFASFCSSVTCNWVSAFNGSRHGTSQSCHRFVLSLDRLEGENAAWAAINNTRFVQINLYIFIHSSSSIIDMMQIGRHGARSNKQRNAQVVHASGVCSVWRMRYMVLLFSCSYCQRSIDSVDIEPEASVRSPVMSSHPVYRHYRHRFPTSLLP